VLSAEVKAARELAILLSPTRRLDLVKLIDEADATSTALPSQEQWICGANSTNFSARRIAMAAWGASLAGKEVSFFQYRE
jgi:hypothetical protein